MSPYSQCCRRDTSAFPFFRILLLVVVFLSSAATVHSFQVHRSYQRGVFSPTIRRSELRYPQKLSRGFSQFPSKRKAPLIFVTLQQSETDGETSTTGQSRLRRYLSFPKKAFLKLWRRNGKQQGDHELPTSLTTSLEQVAEELVSSFTTEETTIEQPPTAISSSGKLKSIEKPSEALRTDRSAIASKNTDLSGEWTLINSDEFRNTYDYYLTLLGQPAFVRSVATSIVGLTTEIIEQTEQGRVLSIKGTNVRGLWERTLTASDAESAVIGEVKTVEGDVVSAESWWVDNGTVHRTWMRGYTRFGGGDFESSRYIDSDGCLVCETTFHPNDSNRKKPKLVWRFQRKS